MGRRRLCWKGVVVTIVHKSYLLTRLSLQRKKVGLNWIEPARRERKGGSYALGGYLKGKAAVEKAAKTPKVPKQMHL